uniref:Putative ovule protein n=1 Tax=Solanum chacoense TaxID=4108 RepID=A0A0V0H2I9_SOLCH
MTAISMKGLQTYYCNITSYFIYLQSWIKCIRSTSVDLNPKIEFSLSNIIYLIPDSWSLKISSSDI